ncbi:MAG: 23S rRNA (adenine(2503)-C(2))-methyltransferase RlmN [Minisyncoccota bacterium]
MDMLTRRAQFLRLYPDVPEYRVRQFELALFDVRKKSFTEISNIPLKMRTVLDTELAWLTLSPVQVFESVRKDTYKAVVELSDKKRVETVLMKNARGHWTICVSSQVGCAMACGFCATGTMGFTRNLTADEIVDQYRFWNIFLAQHSTLPDRISNIVFMGMGEPLANYESVKETIHQILTYTDIGPTRITVSTVGLLPMLQKILQDSEWPAVRLAVSLHSAKSDTRKQMMPTSFDGFLDQLIEWTREYFMAHESRRHHLTFEYVMLSNINDTEIHAKALIDFARRVGNVRINLIPYNFTGSIYRDSLPADFARFQQQLVGAGITVTRRRTMGDDISAACGQLVVEKKTL